ncbi:aromatic ring-opening dioxygenase LigA [Georgenia yuyongxinii]|uniref:Aromatic ring-opening dioxygenase LigA n=1 Tax=Georgenia yuyongxinii TaxID=2589797 RepID=A0A5B8C2V1_9MICO|nr:aromatic ring-opening dioxygenase LigA [Georgenia yuyongxinii]QDC23552.1 aromatic ring-opening dioxygenase LigA [Georgenia yuyongxinii]
MNFKPAKVTGIVAIVAGIIFILAGGVTWGLITSNLAEQNITVAGDSKMLPGDDVNGPFSAFAEAQIIDEHAMTATEGRTYAELGGLVKEAEAAGDTALAEELQGQRTTVMNASFLRASLFTSVVAYGVAALVMGLGVILAVIGWTFTGLAKTAPVTAERKPELVTA